jgi:hypothetical protein
MHNFEFWKDAFPVLYHGSIEEVAERPSATQRLLAIGRPQKLEVDLAADT